MENRALFDVEFEPLFTSFFAALYNCFPGPSEQIDGRHWPLSYSFGAAELVSSDPCVASAFCEATSSSSLSTDRIISFTTECVLRLF